MNSNVQKTKLDRKYCFWYRISEDALLGNTKLLNQNEYENQVKKIAEFECVSIELILDRGLLGNFPTLEEA
jgi:hypothetical protein